VPAEAELLCVTLPAADVMRSLVLEVAPTKLGQAIVVGQVASGSAAEQVLSQSCLTNKLLNAYLQEQSLFMLQILLLHCLL